MRILHVLDHSIPLQSGYTFRTRNILLHQRARGWETAHLTSLKHRGAELSEEEVDGLHFYRTLANGNFLQNVPVVNQWQVVRTLVSRLAQVIEKEKPDILHAHSPALNGLAAISAGKKHGIPVVYECRAFWEDAAVDHGTSKEHGVRYRVTRALETRVFRNADAVTTICEGLRSDIVRRGIPAHKITVIPNAVDIEHFGIDGTPDESLSDQLGLRGRPVIGFIGSFYAYEGIPLLLEAMPGMLNRHPEMRLLLAGGGPQEELIKQKIVELGIQDSVVSVGRVPHARVRDYYNLVDIFVYPRLHMRLTDLVTPLKPLEAMAQGKIVIASDVGGHRELIDSGHNGLLFQANNPESLADAVIRMLEDRAHWENFRRNGRAYVETERNWANSVSRYEPVYKSLLV